MKKRHTETDADGTPGLVWLSDMQNADEDEGFYATAGKPLLFVIFALVAVVALIVIGYSVFSYRAARTEYNRIRSDHVRVTSDPPAAVPVPVRDAEAEAVRPEGANLEIDFEALLAINADTVAWLDLPALHISYPVVRTDDRDYYLSHTFEGNKNAGGAIFVEPVNGADFSDRNTFLYGHNSADGSMFGKLHELAYLEAEREANPFFFIYRRDGRVGKYRIYSCYVTDENSDSFVTFDDDYYDTYVTMTTERSSADLHADGLSGGNIVTLSTCYGGNGTTKRFLVHGMQVE